jgi:MoxR-like ATPase
MEYLSRVADQELADRLRRSGAVLIDGAKGCGKTETASRAAASAVRVDTDPDVAAFMEVDPFWLLDGPAARPPTG